MCLVAQAHGLELNDRALPLNPSGSIELVGVRITLVQAFHNSAPNLVLGSVLEGHYFYPDGGSCGVVLSFNNGRERELDLCPDYVSFRRCFD